MAEVKCWGGYDSSAFEITVGLWRYSKKLILQQSYSVNVWDNLLEWFYGLFGDVLTIYHLSSLRQVTTPFQVGSAYKMLQLRGWKLNVAFCAGNVWLHEFVRVRNSGGRWHSGLWAAASVGSLPWSGNFFMSEISYTVSVCAWWRQTLCITLICPGFSDRWDLGAMKRLGMWWIIENFTWITG